MSNSNNQNQSFPSEVSPSAQPSTAGREGHNAVLDLRFIFHNEKLLQIFSNGVLLLDFRNKPMTSIENLDQSTSNEVLTHQVCRLNSTSADSVAESRTRPGDTKSNSLPEKVEVALPGSPFQLDGSKSSSLAASANIIASFRDVAKSISPNDEEESHESKKRRYLLPAQKSEVKKRKRQRTQNGCSRLIPQKVETEDENCESEQLQKRPPAFEATTSSGCSTPLVKLADLVPRYDIHEEVTKRLSEMERKLSSLEDSSLREQQFTTTISSAPVSTKIKTKRTYVEKTDKDVLMGRGGLSNNHPGNQAYLRHILPLQKDYKDLRGKEKTQCSEKVVQWVKDRGGRFIKRDDNSGPSWYVVDDADARKKVSQVLREDHSEEGRKGARERNEKATASNSD